MRLPYIRANIRSTQVADGPRDASRDASRRLVLATQVAAVQQDAFTPSWPSLHLGLPSHPSRPYFQPT